jgi:chorismate mutase
MENWLPLAEVARQSSIAESTARRYARLFAEYLPHGRDGRTVLYAPESIAILKHIGRLFSEGRTSNQVREVLRRDTGLIDVQAERPDPGTRNNGAAVEESRQRMAAFLRLVVDQKKELAALRLDVSRIGAELTRERERRQNLESQVAKLRKAAVLLIRNALRIPEVQAPVSDEVAAKLGVLEQELVRLRKDRRELEKYLLEKIAEQG